MKNASKSYLLAGICFAFLLTIEVLMLRYTLNTSNAFSHAPLAEAVRKNAIKQLALNLYDSFMRLLPWLFLLLYCFLLHHRRAGIWLFISAFAMQAGTSCYQLHILSDDHDIQLHLLQLLICIGLVHTRLTRYWLTILITGVLVAVFTALRVSDMLEQSLRFGAPGLDFYARWLVLGISWLLIICRCVGFALLWWREGAENLTVL